MMPSFANPEPGISMSSSDTSSSSTSPSPGAQVKVLHHYHHRQQQKGVGNNQWLPSSKRSTTSSSSSSDTSAILGSRTSAPSTAAHAHQFDLPMPPPHHQRGRGRNHSQSTISIGGGPPGPPCLSDTDSSDDSTYSSQYQSDANSTPTTRQSGGSNTLPRPLTGGGQGYGPRARHGAVRRAVIDDSGGSPTKSLTDYEREIMELRSTMETLKVKLNEAESRLVQESSTQPQRAEGEVRVIVNRLAEDEDQLRRTENYTGGGQHTDTREKERMILMQQKKIAALDEANARLIKELSRLGDRLDRTTQLHAAAHAQAQNSRQENQPEEAAAATPKSVDDLLDSLVSTPI